MDSDVSGSNPKQGNDVYQQIPYWPDHV